MHAGDWWKELGIFLLGENSTVKHHKVLHIFEGPSFEKKELDNFLASLRNRTKKQYVKTTGRQILA